MVPEVGIPSIDELVLSECEGGQAHRHGVVAPRDLEAENSVFSKPLISGRSPLNP